MGLNYVKLDGGQVGIIGNGAGLVMSTLMWWPMPAKSIQWDQLTFLDIGGGANAEVMSNGLRVILSDPEVRCVYSSMYSAVLPRDQVG